MRASKRAMILDAVIAIVERDGVTALTFNAVAEETGLTRGGLLYHFPSRGQLILATHRHLADMWEARMTQAAGTTADTAGFSERDAAYIETGVRAATRAELLLMLEGTDNPALAEVWRSVTGRWAPSVPEDDDPTTLGRFIARLAADGLWVHEALSETMLPAELKERIFVELMAMANAGVLFSVYGPEPEVLRPRCQRSSAGGES